MPTTEEELFSVLSLEASIWDSKRSQDRNRIREGPQAIQRIAAKVDNALKIQAQKAPKLTLSRKKREIYHYRNKALLDDFRTEKCGLEMLLADGESAVVRYYGNKSNIITSEVGFIQPSESSINSHLNKSQLRLTGYPQSLVDMLHDRNCIDDGNSTAAALWNIQRQMAGVIGGSRFSEAEPITRPSSLLAMINTLQLGEIMLTKDSKGVEDVTSKLSLFFVLCVDMLMDMLAWMETPEDNGSSAECLYIPLVLTQCVRTLRAVLMSDCEGGFIAHRNQNPEETREYNSRLTNSLVQWMDRLAGERKCPSVLPRDIASPSPNEVFSGGHATHANSLVTDLLVCGKCAVHLLLIESDVSTICHGLGEPYHTDADRLISSGSALSLIVLTELSGIVNPLRRVSQGDVRAAENVYSEASACLNFTAVCFTTGMISLSLLRCLEIGQQVTHDCKYSMAVQSAWLQAILSSILCLSLGPTEAADDDIVGQINAAKMALMKAKINDQPMDEAHATMHIPLKGQFFLYLGTSIHGVLEALSLHINGASIQHMGFLITRLLLRSPFMTNKDIESFLEGVQEQELTEDEVKMRRAERRRKRAEKRQAEKLKAKLRGAENENEGEEEGFPAVAEVHEEEEEDDDGISVTSIDDWKECNRDADDKLIDESKEDIDGKQLSLSEVLVLSGEQNMQSPEVMEQWLLLIHHLATRSAMSKQSLINFYVDRIVHKVLAIQISDTYVIALCEICLSLLKADEEESEI
mmetsp:Transcript_21704/g.31586  ORF Transcript_21704/g.31586 Transcript_21704/m.31586 type:complete len:751 (+) Transcript_21704:108-2360(+)